MATAWDDPETRRHLRRSRRHSRILLVACVALFVAFAFYATSLEDHGDRLVAHGVNTPGVVLDSPVRAVACRQVPIRIEFEVAGERRIYPYLVGSCDSPLRQGQQVTVAYDAQKPSTFAVNGDVSEGVVATFLALVAFCVSLTGLVVWAVNGWQLHHRLRVLRHCAWSRSPCRLTRIVRTSKGSRYAVQRVDDPDATFVVTKLVFSRWAEPVEQTMFLAGPWHGRFVVRSERNWALVLARTPRAWQRKRMDRLQAEHEGAVP